MDESFESRPAACSSSGNGCSRQPERVPCASGGDTPPDARGRATRTDAPRLHSPRSLSPGIGRSSGFRMERCRPRRGAHPQTMDETTTSRGSGYHRRDGRDPRPDGRGLDVRSRRSASVRTSHGNASKAIRRVARDGARRGTPPGAPLARRVVAVMTQSAQRSATGAARARRRRAATPTRPGRRATAFPDSRASDTRRNAARVAWCPSR